MSSLQPSLLPNATRDLARFAVETRACEIPVDVIERLKLSFLDGLGRGDGPLVISDLDGTRPEPHEFESMLALSRSAKSNFSLNAELCRALLESRLNREEP